MTPGETAKSVHDLQQNGATAGLNGSARPWPTRQGAAFALAPLPRPEPEPHQSHVDDAQSVGRRLRAARERSGLTQSALALVGCSASYVSQVEAGNRTPSLQLLRRFADRLGVTEEYLARGARGRREHELGLVEATAALHLGDLEPAARGYHDVYTEARDATLQACALEGLAYVYLRRGDAHGAVSLFQTALETTGEPAAQRPSLAEGLGQAHEALGETRAAIALYEQCLAEGEHDADAVRVLRFASLLGRALLKTGDLERARRILEKARTEAASLNGPDARARAYWAQSRRSSEHGDPGGALRYAAVAVAIREASEDARLLATADALAGELGLPR